MKRKPALQEMAQELDRNLREVRRILRKPVEEEAARLGLTRPQLSVMQVLFRSEGMSLKELSRQVGLAHSTVSGIVDRLEKKGLITRQPDPDDRRLTRIMIPARLRRLGEEKISELQVYPLAEALKRATPAERRTICQGVVTLRRVIESSPHSSPTSARSKTTLRYE
jgi:DNA-binding MarR family transcriptional regulator